MPVFSGMPIYVSGDGNGGDYTVRVLDYDGTVIQQTRLSTGDTFTLPTTTPTHDRLTFQTWTASAPITNNQVTVTNADIDIGAIYATESGATELDVFISEKTSMSVTMQNLTGMTSIDWGDGTTDSTLTHTYTNAGNYTIKIYGLTAIAGSIFASDNYTVTNIWLSNGITSIGIAGFISMKLLETITIPSSVQTIGGYIFANNYVLKFANIPQATLTGTNHFATCYEIRGVVLPYSVAKIVNYVFYQCNYLESFAMPSNATEIGSEVFGSCYRLRKIDLDNITTINTTFSSNRDLQYVKLKSNINLIASMFSGCQNLREFEIPSEITTINASFLFNGCSSLEKVKFPSGITSISGNNMFYNATDMKIYDLSTTTTVPTLGGTILNVTRKNVQILVPNALLSEYKTATNWITYADYIVGV